MEMCVRVIEFVYVSTISRLDFGRVLTVLYIFFIDFLGKLILFSYQNVHR